MSRPGSGPDPRAPRGWRVADSGEDTMGVRVVLGFERVAPNPSRRYTGMPRAAAVERLPDPEHPSPPPCFGP